MSMRSFLAICMFLGVLSGHVFTQASVSCTFKLITTLYNEKNEKRCLEYITCLENNLKNRSIDTVHVVYDTCKDDVHGNRILDYLKSKNIKISYISERASYGDLFEIANKEYPHSKVIVSNADIYFNETLVSLEPYDLRNKFLALTRWDVCPDGTLVEWSPVGHSQDAWIFQTPLPIFENNSIKIGILGCDDAIAYQAQKSGLALFNPALTVQCCHLHRSEIRNYTKDNPYKDAGNIKFIRKCPVMELDDNQRKLLLGNLRLQVGRRAPIIVN